MTSRRPLQWLLFVIVATSCQALRAADTVLPKPATLVTDHAGILSSDEIDTLTKNLQELERAGLAHAIIYIDSALPPGEVLEKLTLRSANAWGIGRKDVNDGLIIFVFMRERKMRIEIGRGLESAIPDADAKSIMDEQMTPAFRQGKYAEGLAQTIRGLRELLLRRRATVGKQLRELIVRPGISDTLCLCLVRVALIRARAA